MSTKVMHYTQVRLEQPSPTGGVFFHEAWLPSPMTKMGHRVRIDGFDGTWTVVERGETKLATDVEERATDYLHQREASDV